MLWILIYKLVTFFFTTEKLACSSNLVSFIDYIKTNMLLQSLFETLLNTNCRFLYYNHCISWFDGTQQANYGV
jgi:hypothetical protein